MILVFPPFYSSKKHLQQEGIFLNGGEGGIRTLDTLPYTHFPGVRLRPLGHFSEDAQSTTVIWPASKLRFKKLC
jgi:hypothetical protein